MVRVLTSFFLAVVPPLSKDDDFKSILEQLKAVDESERSVKFLLNTELLHQYGLLDSSRSIASRSITSQDTLLTPNIQVTDALASTEANTLLELNVESSLKRCSESDDSVESSRQRTGKALMRVIEEDESQMNQDDTNVFGDLSDIVASQELIKDATLAPKPSVSVAEVSIAPTPTPPTQALSSISQIVTTPRSKSGLLLDACSLHSAHT